MFSPGKTLIVLLILIGSVVAQEDFRIRETNRNYEVGDWITWSVTRFVRYISIGDQYVYFATTGGITRYNFYSNQWEYPLTISNGLADNNIYLVARDPNTGFLWCTHPQGISYMEPASRWWFNFFYDEMPGFGFDAQITSIGFGDDRQVYVVTRDNNWYSSDNVSANFRRISQPDSDAHIQWFGARENNDRQLPYFFMSDGYIFDERQRVIDDLHLRNFRITYWVTDPWKNLWLGTWGLGAGHGDLNTYRLDLLEYGLWDETVDAIGVERDAFWLGGVQNHDQPAGITEWRPSGQKPNYYEAYLLNGFDSGQVTAIVPDGDNVWVGTRDGLTRYNRRNGNWRTLTTAHRLANNSISDLLVDDRYIWAATERGVSQISKRTVGTDSLRIKNLMRSSLANVGVYDLDRQKNLIWMATEFGVFVYDTEKDKGGFYKGIVGPSGTPTFALSVYNDEVWFASEDGIAAFNSLTREWLNPPARYHQIHTGINRMLSARDAVWVATNDGVWKYNRRNQSWVHFTMYDGLPSNNVYSLYLEGDYIWFGSDKGLTRFYWNSPYRTD